MLLFFIENWMQKYSQEGFFFPLMCNPNIEVMNITKWVQVIFNIWFDYFEYVSYLSNGITLIVFNVSIWSLSTSAGLPDWGASSSKKSLAWNFGNHFWHTQSITSPYTSPYLLQTLHKSFFFFLHFCCIFTFLEIIQHNMLLFPSIFNIKMATQKFTNFAKFLMCDMTAITIQSNKIVLNEVKDN